MKDAARLAMARAAFDARWIQHIIRNGPFAAATPGVLAALFANCFESGKFAQRERLP